MGGEVQRQIIRRISVTKSDKEDMFIILSIMLLVTWYDHSIGYRLGVAGV